MTEPIVEDRRPGPGRLVGFAVLLAVVSWGLGAFSAFPWTASDPEAALLKVAFKHVAAFERESRRLSPEELAKLPRHMRPLSPEGGRTGRRRDTLVRVALDGHPLLAKTYRPGGLRHDGPTFGYEELPLPLGRHLLEATLTDAGSPGADESGADPHWQLRQEVHVDPGRVVLMEFSEEQGLILR